MAYKESQDNDEQVVRHFNDQENKQQQINKEDIANKQIIQNENIPQLTEEEKQKLEEWRNSSEMQTGLKELLPQDQPSDDATDSDSGNLSNLFLQWQQEENADEQQNNTGIPENLKQAIERLSGLSLDDITVHYNSDLPAKNGALAYAQGNEIHIAPNQEEHLPHELAHIVQQKEGRVQSTQNIDGININDDKSLEKEADEMGDKAAGMQDSGMDTPDLDQKPVKNIVQKKVMQQVGENATWQPPMEGFAAVSTASGAATAMAMLGVHLVQMKDALPDGSDTANIDDMVEEIQAWAEHFNTQEGTNLDGSFTAQMESFNTDFRTVYSAGMQLVRQPSLDAVRSLRGGRTLTPIDNDTKDALRAAFAGGSESTLQSISDIIGAIEEYNGKINQWTEYIGYLGDSIRGANTIARINEITGSIGSVAEKVGQVITAMQSLGTLLDATNQATTETMQSINDMEAAFNAIDLGMNFVSGVPILSALWSSYYMPAIEICMTGLRQIAELRSQQAHQLVELQIQTRRDQTHAPSLAGMEDHFQGGQAVLDFMWQVMRGQEVEPSQTVHDYFVEHQDLFEAGSGDHMTVTGTGLTDFWESNQVQSLYYWARNNRDRVWAMLYGSRLTPPR